MTTSMDQRMDGAIAFFAELASSAKTPERRRMLEHLREMAEATQQNARMLDVLKLELEGIHHTR